jgi:hypothetical protein
MMKKFVTPLILVVFLVLIALSSIACVQAPWHDSDWFHFNPPFFGFPFFGTVLYFLPIIIAAIRRSKNLVGIVLLNVLGGWTGIGWIIALIWACAGETKKVSA